MKNFEILMDTCIEILKLPIRIDEYTITLWEVLLYGSILFLIMFFIFRLHK